MLGGGVHDVDAASLSLKSVQGGAGRYRTGGDRRQRLAGSSSLDRVGGQILYRAGLSELSIGGLEMHQ